MYSERLLAHFHDPRNVGDLPLPATTVEVSNPACGDILRLAARIEDGRLAVVRYRTRGCTASIAAGSALTEWLTGKTPVEAAAVSSAILEQALDGLPAESRHAAVLCLDGVRALLKALASEMPA